MQCGYKFWNRDNVERKIRDEQNISEVKIINEANSACSLGSYGNVIRMFHRNWMNSLRKRKEVLENDHVSS